MPDRLDFDSARRVIEATAPTDTWDDATRRAETAPMVQLEAEDATASTPLQGPLRPRPHTIRLLAIAACLIAVVALAAVVTGERQSVDTISPSESPTTECPSPTQQGAITQGAQMKQSFVAPVVSVATALVLLGGCSDDETTTSDDGPTTLAKGDVTFAGSQLLEGQTMDIDAVEQDGQVTGEARFSFGTNLDLQCADTDTDGLVLLGGEVTAEDGDSATVGDWVVVAIREGDPDSVVLWYELPLAEGEVAAGSCGELLDAFPFDQLESEYNDIAEGDDIETG